MIATSYNDPKAVEFDLSLGDTVTISYPQAFYVVAQAKTLKPNEAYYNITYQLVDRLVSTVDSTSTVA